MSQTLKRKTPSPPNSPLKRGITNHGPEPVKNHFRNYIHKFVASHGHDHAMKIEWLTEAGLYILQFLLFCDEATFDDFTHPMRNLVTLGDLQLITEIIATTKAFTSASQYQALQQRIMSALIAHRLNINACLLCDQ